MLDWKTIVISVVKAVMGAIFYQLGGKNNERKN
jgi:hypothetical protein